MPEGNKKQVDGKLIAKSSIGFGTILAITLSWTSNQAILWAIIHGVLGWLYVIYYLVVRDDWSWF